VFHSERDGSGRMGAYRNGDFVEIRRATLLVTWWTDRAGPVTVEIDALDPTGGSKAHAPVVIADEGEEAWQEPMLAGWMDSRRR
jgi:hypothetical protein